MIKTNKNFTYATYTRRWFAGVIDSFIIFLPLDALILLFGIYVGDHRSYIFINAFVFITLYQTIFLCSSWKATPGGKLLGLKVVNDNCTGLNFKTSLIRSCFSTLFLEFFVVLLSRLSFYLVSTLYHHTHGAFKGIIFGLWVFLVLLIPLAMIYVVFSLINKKRTIYDYLSKTHVIISNNQQDQ